MIILDSWHWVRADQPYDILTKEIAKKVVSIQINDAYERPYAAPVLRDESMHDRLAPGRELRILQALSAWSAKLEYLRSRSASR